MKNVSSIVTVVVMGTLWGAGAARADIPPADACTSPGQPCQVAGPNYDQPGICQTATCTRGTPDGHGGVTTTTYACNRCELSGAGGAGGQESGTAGTSGSNGGAGGTPAAAGGAGGTPAAAGGAGGAPAAAGTGGQPVLGGPSKVSKSSGCAVAGSDGAPGLTALLLMALLLTRRARTTNE